MEEQEERDEALKRKETASFTLGTGTNGAYKFYFDLNKPLEELKVDLDKAMKVLEYFLKKGYCTILPKGGK